MEKGRPAHDSPVLHVIVIGFHHKKGCQVEYSYPPLIEGNPVDSNQVPDEWKHLPSLGIPDGAHNYTKDTIFFHLPSRTEKHKTVYGVACYRQIDAKDLLNKTSDVTRSTVQKSVCVLSKLPLFGLIQTKLELITHAYFDEKDFSKVELLEETYRNLTASITDSMKDGSSICLGMSVRDVVIEFKHKIVLLFKLILLERRVLFSGTPVEKLCNTLLSILSLFPGMVEFGLEEAATCSGQRLLSPTLHSAKYGSDDSDEFLEVHYSDDKPKTRSPSSEERTQAESSPSSVGSAERTQAELELSRSLSVEPESPTMDRDCEVDSGSANSSYVNIEPEVKDTCDIKPDDSDVKDTCDIKPDDSEVKDTCDIKTAESAANSICDISNCDKTTVEFEEHEGHNHLSTGILIGSHNFTETKILCSNSDNHNNLIKGDSLIAVGNDIKPKGRSNSDSNSVHSTHSDPFMDMKSLTQIEAVQTGETILNVNSVINIEEFQQKCEEFDDKEKPSSLEISLNLEDLKRSNSIEDIDSPESIQKIDREDCFSWEEDSLLLTIDPVLDLSGDHSQPNPSTEMADERIENVKEIENEINVKPNDCVIKADSSTEDMPKVHETVVGESSPDISDKDSKKSAGFKNKLSTAFGGLSVKDKFKNRKSNNNKMVPMQDLKDTIPVVPKIEQDDCGFPLVIFTKGYICHPYLSLQYYDLLNDVNVRGFVIGATNFLFKQKRHLTDIVIEISEGKIDFHDRELQKILNLTTADLRFADIIVKAVIGDSEDGAFETTGWEGGDEWLRAQFRVYLQSLLVTCKQDDVKLHEDFGLSFLQAFKTTHCYKVWLGDEHKGMNEIPAGHPCHGNIGVSDIRVRLAHSMQSTERGKKINAAVTQTGKYVVQTGKVVGGAINHARSAVSSWFSNFTQDWKKEEKTQPESSS